MPSDDASPPVDRYRLDSASVDAVPRGGPVGLRLRGRERGSGRLLLVDAFGADTSGSAAGAPGQRTDLREVTLVRQDGGWRIEAGAQALPFEPRTVFVHEDVGAAVEAVVPPRRVPLLRRAFWRAVFLLIRTGPTRRWLMRRYVR